MQRDETTVERNGRLPPMPVVKSDPPTGRGAYVFQAMIAALLAATVLYLGLAVVPDLRRAGRTLNEAAASIQSERTSELEHATMINLARQQQVNGLAELLNLQRQALRQAKELNPE